MRQLLFLLLLVPIGLLFLAVVTVLAPVLRWIGRLAVATVAALVTALLIPGALGGWAPFAAFAATLTLMSLGERRRPARARAAAADRVIDQPAAVPGPGPAWRELRGLADWRSRRRLDAAWEACARYLAAAEAQENPSAQLPIKIARHVPAVVADCVRHSRTATADERRSLVADTLATLEGLADRAETRRRELAHHAQGEFRARRAHLDTPED